MNEENDILNSLREQIKPTSEGYPFRAPGEYFLKLEDQLLAKIEGEPSLNEVQMAGDNKKPTFVVPDSYFENLTDAILKKTGPAPVKKIFLKKWQQIAAAAITAIVILSGVYYGRDKGAHEIVVQHQSKIAPVIRNVSAGELASFLEESSGITTNGSADHKPIDMNQLFQKISSEDLESFLNETAANNTELF